MLEVFYRTKQQNLDEGWNDEEGELCESGWYYWYCQPGCLPDSEPIGPFPTKDEALSDALDQDE